MADHETKTMLLQRTLSRESCKAFLIYCEAEAAAAAAADNAPMT